MNKVIKLDLSKSITEDKLKKACIILESANTTVNSFFEAFKLIRTSGKTLKPKKGSSTDEEQDLLRAMLLFSSSGLDAVIKQLINDSYETIVKKDDQARSQFQIFVERKLKKSDNKADEGSKEYTNLSINSKFLAEILVSNEPQNLLIQSMIRDLTSDSLQSFEQLSKVGQCFGIATSDFIKDNKEMEEIFRIRNEITHRMDIDLKKSKRTRTPRKQRDMIKFSNILLETSARFIEAVLKKLA